MYRSKPVLADLNIKLYARHPKTPWNQSVYKFPKQISDFLSGCILNRSKCWRVYAHCCFRLLLGVLKLVTTNGKSMRFERLKALPGNCIRCFLTKLNVVVIRFQIHRCKNANAFKFVIIIKSEIILRIIRVNRAAEGKVKFIDKYR